MFGVRDLSFSEPSHELQYVFPFNVGQFTPFRSHFANSFMVELAHPMYEKTTPSSAIVKKSLDE